MSTLAPTVPFVSSPATPRYELQYVRVREDSGTEPAEPEMQAEAEQLYSDLMNVSHGDVWDLLAKCVIDNDLLPGEPEIVRAFFKVLRQIP